MFMLGTRPVPGILLPWSHARCTRLSTPVARTPRAMKRIFRIAGVPALLFAGFIYLNNADWLTSVPAGSPVLLAHRGLAQTFDLDGVTNDSCTAARIHAPTHPYLENTLASMAAA